MLSKICFRVLLCALHLFVRLFDGTLSWIRWTQSYFLSLLYHHHCSHDLIRRDTESLKKRPKHIAVIVDYSEEGGIEALVDSVCELSAWCLCSGIYELTVYEKNGYLKEHPTALQKAIESHLPYYFGELRINVNVSSPCSPEASAASTTESHSDQTSLNLRLIAREDGRDAIIDLARGLVDLSVKHVITSTQVNMELIDKELSESVIPEPDLLIVFSKKFRLQGFPPWHLRLCEIYYDESLRGVNYLTYFKALIHYSDAEMRLGH
ncbi:di-trans,poly-cis-decaprenylcistransferase [Schizosaccharomyces japonicus yFS275]|uniref:ditrans,polycis-polyprenyl diphosphate synthase [(2E,6E)-farnesyldiphosphate specific] n=1 Tax=Schizosaccharomyces japonicus (strain yFS275 / FY16936) TaxID=402676 RepID=B6JVY9_SCHJY|nr:di-trans,poly-cis-decaprenylcistransferase [Schizosaccharomyces japonicus yFS275]EEB05540.1 di-trans,poly-cis-decaprenylcistransferase [Schizosaccharomyces japonicus yFS275]